MPDCPLADECPEFDEQIQGMGCQHYGNRGGAEWCKHFDMPIAELKKQPVTPGEEVVVEVDDIHESGAGVGRTDDGFIVLVDGLLPPARARVRIDTVKSNHARAKEVAERLPEDPDDPEAGDGEDLADENASDEEDSEAGEDSEDDEESREGIARERLGSRENFWGK